jgi:hypothetical protein
MGNTILLLELVLPVVQLVPEVILDVAVYFRQLQLQVEVVAVSIPHLLLKVFLVVKDNLLVLEVVEEQVVLEEQLLEVRGGAGGNGRGSLIYVNPGVGQPGPSGTYRYFGGGGGGAGPSGGGSGGYGGGGDGIPSGGGPTMFGDANTGSGGGTSWFSGPIASGGSGIVIIRSPSAVTLSVTSGCNSTATDSPNW